MPSTENQQHTFPAVPPSLSAGDHEMRDYYATQNAPRPTINQAPHLTPYLGLRARLSQIWINRWTVLLFLVLVRTLLAVSSLNDNLDSARQEAQSACLSVENAGSTMASMPHYMSKGVNELAATGVEKAVNGLMSMLMLSITGVEEIVVFVINLLTSTYVCLITLAVSGSLQAALALAEDVTNFLHNTVGSLGDDIAKDVGSFQADLNNFLSSIKGLPLVGSQVPTLDVNDSISKLHNLQTPVSVQTDLQKLNSSIPTFAQVNNLTNTAIRFPFEEVKTLVNGTLHTFQFNRSLFPVPQKEKLSFCSDSNGINSFFDGLVELEITARKIFIAVIVILAILVCVPMVWWEIRRFRIMQERAQLVSQHSTDPMDAMYLASRPYSSSVGLKIAGRFSSIRTQTLVRWIVAYATSAPALFVLALGVTGLLACLCQYILLKIIEKEVPSLTNQVGDFADKVVSSLNNASEQWAIGTNQAINTTNADINHEVFGWVNTTTHAVNDTLNTFVDGMTDVLNKTFGGTVLYDPIKGVLDCLVTLKVEGVQKGLTWVSDNAHVDLPMLAPDTFSLGAAAALSNDSSSESFLAAPQSSTKDEISGAVISLTNKLEDALRTEAIISMMLVLLWLIIFILGCIRTLMGRMERSKSRAEGGQAYFVDPVTDAQRGHDLPRPEESAPPYEYQPSTPVNKEAPYTLARRPFPTFDVSPSAARRLDDEKVGQVGSVSAPVGSAVTRPDHMRVSSHGHLARTTPTDEKFDPFADQHPL